MFSIACVFAQNEQEFEIMINGKKEKIKIRSEYKVVTPEGDTVIYQFKDIVENLEQEQPEKPVQNNPQSEEIKQEKAVTETKPVKEEPKKTAPEKPLVQVKQENVVKVEAKIPTKAETKQLSDSTAVKPITEIKSAEEKQQLIETAKAKQRKEFEEKKVAIEAEAKIAEEKKPEEKPKAEPLDTLAKKEEKKALVPENLIYNKPVVAEIKPAEGVVAREEKTLVTITKPAENVVSVEKKPEPVKTTAAVGIVAEEAKPASEKTNPYAFKKYFVADQNINAKNIAQKDTLKLIATELSVYKDFPSMQFGGGNDILFCYDEEVCSYHGYDEEIAKKYTTRYKICQTGTWSDIAKTADAYMNTPEGKKKLKYTIVQLDDKNLVLVKR